MIYKMKGRGPRPAESSPEQTPSAATESPEQEKADGALAEFQPQGRHSVSISPVTGHMVPYLTHLWDIMIACIGPLWNLTAVL